MYLTTLIVVSLGTFVARSFCAQTSGVNHYVTTTIQNGVVRGRSLIVNGKTIDTYYEIPYAQPPLGKTEKAWHLLSLTLKYQGRFLNGQRGSTCILFLDVFIFVL